jgi:hypothetical protein
MCPIIGPVQKKGPFGHNGKCGDLVDNRHAQQQGHIEFGPPRANPTGNGGFRVDEKQGLFDGNQSQGNLECGVGKVVCEKTIIFIGWVDKPHVGVADAEKVNGSDNFVEGEERFWKLSEFVGIVGSKVGAGDKDAHEENEEDDAQGSYLASWMMVENVANVIKAKELVNLGFFQRDIHKECRERT